MVERYLLPPTALRVVDDDEKRERIEVAVAVGLSACIFAVLVLMFVWWGRGECFG